MPGVASARGHIANTGNIAPCVDTAQPLQADRSRLQPREAWFDRAGVGFCHDCLEPLGRFWMARLKMFEVERVIENGGCHGISSDGWRTMLCGRLVFRG